jgi:hypothetical protein
LAILRYFFRCSVEIDLLDIASTDFGIASHRRRGTGCDAKVGGIMLIATSSAPLGGYLSPAYLIAIDASGSDTRLDGTTVLAGGDLCCIE